MKRIGTVLLLLGAVSYFLFGGVGSVGAVPLTFDLTNGFNQQASVIFDYDDSNATVHLSVANTSASGSSPIVGFQFNVPDGVYLSSFAGPENWYGNFDLNGVEPLIEDGVFNMGARAGANGIKAGSFHNFSFVLSGATQGLFNEDFLLQSSDPSETLNEDPNFRYFAVNFYGNIVTTPVAAAIASENATHAHAPEPATLFLLGSGLVGLAGFRSRFKKK